MVAGDVIVGTFEMYDSDLVPSSKDEAKRLMATAWLLGKSGRIQPACALLEQLAEVAGSHAILHSDIGLIYSGIGLIAEALASFERGRRIDPDDSRIAED